jgi:hypothetical protein
MTDEFGSNFQRISGRGEMSPEDKILIYNASNELLSVITGSGLEVEDITYFIKTLVTQQKNLRAVFTEFNIQDRHGRAGATFPDFFFGRYVQEIFAHIAKRPSLDDAYGKKLIEFGRKLPAAIQRCIEIRRSQIL